MFAFNAGLVTLRDHAPRRHWVTATGSFACPATHRMIHGVFRNCSAERTNSTMSSASGFAQNYVLVFCIPDLPDGGVSVLVDPANLPGQQPDLLLMPAGDAAAGDAAIAVAPAGFLANLNQVLLRLCLGNLVKRRDGDVARRWRERSEAFYWHNKFLRQNDLVAFLEGHDGFLPVRSFAGLGGALAACFAAHVHSIDSDDLYFEKFLHSLPNLRFGSAAISHDCVLIQLFALASAFFCQAGSLDDFK